MTWLKLDDGFHLHAKVAPLSDRAWRLHVTALLECCRGLTDGRIKSSLPPTWPAAPRGKALTATIAELERAGLWEPAGDGWTAHDFLDWNPTAAEVIATRKARSEAGKAGGKRAAEARAKADQVLKQLLEQTPSKTEANHQAKSNPVPVPVPEEKIPLPPSEPSRPRPDPFLATLTGRRTQDDPGVIAVFEAWKLAHGSVNSKFRLPADARADILFEAINTHSVEDCLRVLEASKTDPMVTGKADEQGQEHRSVEYIFKPTTFDRLLRAAELARKKTRAAGGLEASMNAEPDLSDYDAEAACPPQ